MAQEIGCSAATSELDMTIINLTVWIGGCFFRRKEKLHTAHAGRARSAVKVQYRRRRGIECVRQLPHSIRVKMVYAWVGNGRFAALEVLLAGSKLPRLLASNLRTLPWNLKLHSTVKMFAIVCLLSSRVCMFGNCLESSHLDLLDIYEIGHLHVF